MNTHANTLKLTLAAALIGIVAVMAVACGVAADEPDQGEPTATARVEVEAGGESTTQISPRPDDGDLLDDTPADEVTPAESNPAGPEGVPSDEDQLANPVVNELPIIGFSAYGIDDSWGDNPAFEVDLHLLGGTPPATDLEINLEITDAAPPHLVTTTTLTLPAGAEVGTLTFWRPPAYALLPTKTTRLRSGEVSVLREHQPTPVATARIQSGEGYLIHPDYGQRHISTHDGVLANRLVVVEYHDLIPTHWDASATRDVIVADLRRAGLHSISEEDVTVSCGQIGQLPNRIFINSEGEWFWEALSYPARLFEVKIDADRVDITAAARELADLPEVSRAGIELGLKLVSGREFIGKREALCGRDANFFDPSTNLFE